MFRTFLTAIAFTLTLTPAFAQEVIGTITGTLDNEDRIWYVTAINNNSQSNWADKTPTDINIRGHATDATIMGMKDGLSIDFNLVDNEALSYTVMITYSDSTVKGSYYASRPEDVTLTITSVSKDGDKLMLEGTFTATMFYSEDYAMTQDRENSKAAEGAFTVTLMLR